MPKAVSDLKTADGQIEVALHQESILFCNKMDRFLNMSEYYFDNVVTLSKAVNNKCTELKDILMDLGQAFKHISQVNKMAKLEEAEDLFM